MQHPDEAIRKALLAMKEEDFSVRAELIAEGALSEGYHPRMEAVHRNNATRLTGIIEQYGWPGKSRVGEDGAEAAWLIAQHAIGDPPFMRRCLSLLQQAGGSGGETPLWQAAMLEDRIRMFEGRPQIYGSQFQPDENGQMVPYTIEDPDRVDERRRAVGLVPLQGKWAELKEQAAQEKVPLPTDWREKYHAWLLRVGWRD